MKKILFMSLFLVLVALTVPAHAEWSLTGNAPVTQTNVSVPSNVDGIFKVRNLKGEVVKTFKLGKTQTIVIPNGFSWTFEGSNVDAKYNGDRSTLRVAWGYNGTVAPYFHKDSPALLILEEKEFLEKGGSNYLMAQGQWVGSHAATALAVVGPIAIGGKGKDAHFWGGLEIRIEHKSCGTDSMDDLDLVRWIELQTALANGVVSYSSLSDGDLSFLKTMKEDRAYQRDKDSKTATKTIGAACPKPEDFGLSFGQFPTRDGDSICMTTTAKVDVLLQREWNQAGKAKMKADQLCAEAGRPVRITFHPGMVLRLVDPATRTILISFDDKGQVKN